MENVDDNLILGGYVSYIPESKYIPGAEKLKSQLTRKIFSSTLNYFYEKEKDIGFNVHTAQQYKNSQKINKQLISYVKSPTNIIQKIFSENPKNIKFGKKTNIRRVKIEQKYNSFVYQNLQSIVEAEQIENYKTRIRKYFSNKNMSPMVNKLQKSIIQKSNTQSIYRSPRKTMNPSITAIQRNQYKGLNKQIKRKGKELKV